jgi:hypothetical protein
MNNKIQQMLAQIPSFLVLGIAIALIVGLFIMLSYVLIWGVFLGGIIWIAMVIKNFLFPRLTNKKEGRILDHDDKE